jgi:hypothetical protein
MDEIDQHEEIAIRFVDIISDIRQLQKIRKKDNKIVSTIADHLAEMLRGSTDLEFLNEVVQASRSALKEKENVQTEEDAPPLDEVMIIHRQAEDYDPC